MVCQAVPVLRKQDRFGFLGSDIHSNEMFFNLIHCTPPFIDGSEFERLIRV